MSTVIYCIQIILFEVTFFGGLIVTGLAVCKKVPFPPVLVLACWLLLIFIQVAFIVLSIKIESLHDDEDDEGPVPREATDEEIAADLGGDVFYDRYDRKI